MVEADTVAAAVMLVETADLAVAVVREAHTVEALEATQVVVAQTHSHGTVAVALHITTAATSLTVQHSTLTKVQFRYNAFSF